jgi:hypothetical protein
MLKLKPVERLKFVPGGIGRGSFYMDVETKLVYISFYERGYRHFELLKGYKHEEDKQHVVIDLTNDDDDNDGDVCESPQKKNKTEEEDLQTIENQHVEFQFNFDDSELDLNIDGYLENHCDLNFSEIY